MISLYNNLAKNAIRLASLHYHKSNNSTPFSNSGLEWSEHRQAACHKHLHISSLGPANQIRETEL